jgi:hypothetical protein
MILTRKQWWSHWIVFLRNNLNNQGFYRQIYNMEVSSTVLPCTNSTIGDTSMAWAADNVVMNYTQDRGQKLTEDLLNTKITVEKH